jgi:DNA-binding transcriptional LysR family regulator
MKTSETSTRLALRKAAWAGSWATLRDLEILQAVIEEGKTTLAAARLGVSQPAVSRTLSLLEEKSGRELFRHEGTALVPTADALALYEAVQPIFDSLARLKEFEWAEGSAQVLRVAAPPTMAQCFLDGLTAQFLKANPDVTISFDIVTTPEVLELVADQRADVGVVDVAAGSTGLRRSVFRRSKMVCALAKDHPLATKKKISPIDLHGEQLILLAKRNALRPVIDRLLAKEGSKPRMVIETSTAISALTYVAEGLGVTLLNPFPAALQLPKKVVLREFAIELPYEASFFMPASAVSSAVAQRYMEFVRQHQPSRLFMSEPVD